jgi:tetratricopeptide (TPR) repeat protein
MRRMVNSKLHGQYLLPLLTVLFLFTGCCYQERCLDPSICYTPQERHLNSLPSAFSPLSPEERKEPWALEIDIGVTFAKELDLYRALTSFKRAKALLPTSAVERRQQIDFDILLSYYLGRKYQEVINHFEQSTLLEVTDTFPSYDSLLIVIYDSYTHLCAPEKAQGVLSLIRQRAPETASNLELATAILAADLERIRELSQAHPSPDTFESLLDCYCQQKKSPTLAQFLNAAAPGTGYLYVGQHRSAITSFFVNTLFTWAAIRFFEEGDIAAGIIASSLEIGWYLGGINGAGLAAQEYNQRLYECYGKEALLHEHLFPVLQFNKAF